MNIWKILFFEIYLFPTSFQKDFDAIYTKKRRHMCHD